MFDTLSACKQFYDLLFGHVNEWMAIVQVNCLHFGFTANSVYVKTEEMVFSVKSPTET